MKILPYPIMARALARFRSSANACSHSAIPSAARLVNMSTSPIWDRRQGCVQLRFGCRKGRNTIGRKEKCAFDYVRACRSNERGNIVGIGGESEVEKSASLRNVVGGYTPIEPSQTLKIEVHRVGGWSPFRASSFGGVELGVQRVRQARDDFVLHVEEIGERLIEPLGPEMITRFGVAELHVNAHAVSAALNTAFEDIADVQLAPDRLHVDPPTLVGERRITGDNISASYPGEVGREALGDSVDERLLLGAAADIGERHDDDREARRGGFLSRRERRGLRPRGLADVERIDPDRLGDVLELDRTEIADREIKPPLHLTIGVLGKTDRAGLCDPFQARGDIDAVAHEIAVGLFDDVAQMNADAELDALVCRDTRVAFDHSDLDFARAA